MLDIDPEVAPAVREMFHRAANGEKMRDIARAVEELGLWPPRLIRLHPTAVSHILKNPVYAGRVHAGPVNVLDHAPARWPALVDDSLWKRVHDRRSTPLWGRSRGEHLLSGFVRCERCGSRGGIGASSRPDRGPYRFYRCLFSSYCEAYIAPEQRLDAAVLRRARTMLSAFTKVATRHRRHGQSIWRSIPNKDGRRRETDRLDKATDRTRQRLIRATELLAAGDLEYSDYELVRDVLEKELYLQRPVLAQSQEVSPVPSLATVLARVPDWESALSGTDVARQREALADLVEQVVPHRLRYARYRLEIHWTPLARTIRGYSHRLSHFGGPVGDDQL